MQEAQSRLGGVTVSYESLLPRHLAGVTDSYELLQPW